MLTEIYSKRATRVYSEINTGIDKTAMWLNLLACFAVLLATAGAWVISRNVAKPIADITRVTEAVAAGDSSISVPFSERSDEIGALARSIGVFQRAMRSNEELNRTVRGDAEMRTQRQEQISNEIARFSGRLRRAITPCHRRHPNLL
ncbi:MAG TPA: HAMP domain-containing protein [Pseudolabrys sp.]|nr:HAMP domain-containing protein [Pseudolabrys sp.]